MRAEVTQDCGRALLGRIGTVVGDNESLEMTVVRCSVRSGNGEGVDMTKLVGRGPPRESELDRTMERVDREDRPSLRLVPTRSWSLVDGRRGCSLPDDANFTQERGCVGHNR